LAAGLNTDFSDHDLLWIAPTFASFHKFDNDLAASLSVSEVDINGLRTAGFRGSSMACHDIVQRSDD